MGIYEDIGVKKLINAYGTVTRVGGSIMPIEVLDTMKEASQHFVDLDELHEKAGKRIAEIIGVEAAFVTSGAAAGLTIATAACIAGKDQFKIERLPDTEGMKNEVIILKSHRFRYDQAIRQAGARLVEVGLSDRTYPWEIQESINEKTAAIAYLEFTEFEKMRGSLPLQKILEIAEEAEIPVIVDAAAELPPVSNLRKFTDQGADLVIFSGGKDIRGPQSSGLVLGNKDLIEACAANSCPNHSIGRPMKADKEAIVGLLKALEIYVNQDFDAITEKWERQVKYIIDNLSDLSNISVERRFPNEPGIQPTNIPRAYVEWDEENLGKTKQQVIELLRAEDPGILVGESEHGIICSPQVLAEREEKVVVDGLKKVLSKER